MHRIIAEIELSQLRTLKSASDIPDTEMRETQQQKLSRMHRWIQSFCGLYSRVADRFRVDRSYVSRIARGERSSPEISQALIAEFERIQRDTPK